MYIEVIEVTDDGQIHIEIDDEMIKFLLEKAINDILREAIIKHENDPETSSI